MEEASRPSRSSRKVATNTVVQLAQSQSEDIRAIRDATDAWLATLLEEVSSEWLTWSVLVRMGMQPEAIHNPKPFQLLSYPQLGCFRHHQRLLDPHFRVDRL
jgi:hypothetical protein